MPPVLAEAQAAAVGKVQVERPDYARQPHFIIARSNAYTIIHRKAPQSQLWGAFFGCLSKPAIAEQAAYIAENRLPELVAANSDSSRKIPAAR